MLMSPAEMCARHSFSRSLPDYSSTYYGTLQKTVILLYSHPSSTPVPTQHRRPSPPAVAPRDFGAPYTILNTVILLYEHPLPHSRTRLPPRADPPRDFGEPTPARRGLVTISLDYTGYSYNLFTNTPSPILTTPLPQILHVILESRHQPGEASCGGGLDLAALTASGRLLQTIFLHQVRDYVQIYVHICIDRNRTDSTIHRHGHCPALHCICARGCVGV